MINYPAHVMPFPPVHPNPAQDACRQRIWEWVDRNHLAADDNVRRLLRRANPELTTARYFPSASPELFVYLAQWMAWIFINDDQFDDGRLGRDATHSRLAVTARLDVLDGAVGPGVMERTLAELWSRLPQGRSPGWYAMFRHDLGEFLRTYDTESDQRCSAQMPTLDDYLAHRKGTAGTRWCADLVEVAVDVDFPDDLRRLPAYRTVKDAAAEHCGLINDMYSAGKELASGQIHNAVCLIMNHQGCGVDEALRRVNDMATECLHAFEDAARTLPRSDDVARWVAGVRDLVRGNFDWHFESERYRGDHIALTANTPGSNGRDD